jgi:putative hemolysin
METGLRFEIGRDPRAARALRRRVFCEELGVPEAAEADPFDAVCEHAILRDPARPELGAVAAARIGADAGYTAREFDLARLRTQPRPVAEIGRTCLHPDYRGGLAGMALFHGVLGHLARREIGFLVGTASLPGADPARHMPALRRLRQEALAPSELRPVARGADAVTVAGEAPRDAMRAVPPLIKSYLRAGAWVGEGAWLDRGFDCVDVCILLDLDRVRLPGRRSRAGEGLPA